MTKAEKLRLIRLRLDGKPSPLASAARQASKAVPRFAGLKRTGR